MTSLTVASVAARSAFSASSSVSTKATRRSRPISWLRKVRGAVGPAGGELRERLGGPHHPPRGRARHRQRLARRLAAPPAAGRGRGPRRRGRRASRGSARRAPSAPRGARSRVPSGLGVEDHRADVDRGDAVDERVVGLADVRVALAFEPLDQVELPQRPGQVERLRHHPADQLAQLGGPPGFGNATRRTWRSMSKRASSAQTGLVSAIGAAEVILWRKRGISARRASTWST